MKIYLMFTILVLSSLLTYKAQGIRLGKVTLSPSNHEDIVKISLVKGSSEDGQSLVQTAEISSGNTIKKRRLSCKAATKNSHDGHCLPKIHEDYYGPRHHPPRTNRKLMTKIISSKTTTIITKKSDEYKHDPEAEVQSTHGLIGKEETSSFNSLQNSKHWKTEVSTKHYPYDIDIAGMDYTPARKKSPVHN
ncbi:hypothetical protein Ccrd_004215 [Cynara cardunculus var. scolymus]|uniref:Uncharacterized protein n=1 Tax=Cynara cardunculus var. scolymus TaxID=59895 RepID=A0A103XN91_CYNCS|nr:hypothetical protein Ccrd_004215 [Cynara cardunculus var. scolymus]